MASDKAVRRAVLRARTEASKAAARAKKASGELRHARPATVNQHAARFVSKRRGDDAKGGRAGNRRNAIGAGREG